MITITINPLNAALGAVNNLHPEINADVRIFPEEYFKVLREQVGATAKTCLLIDTDEGMVIAMNTASSVEDVILSLFAIVVDLKISDFPESEKNAKTFDTFFNSLLREMDKILGNTDSSRIKTQVSEEQISVLAN